MSNETDYEILRYKLANDASSIALWDMDIKSEDPYDPENIIIWSDKFRQMLGYTDENDFPNKLQCWIDSIHPDDREETLQAIVSQLKDSTRKTPINVEYRLKLKNGEYRYFRTFGTALRDYEGNPIRIAGALEDIHEKKQMVETIKRRAVMVDALNTALEIFISHGESTFDRIMTHGIRVIADSLGLDRVTIYRYKDTDESRNLKMTYLWDRDADGIVNIVDSLDTLSEDCIFSGWSTILSQGYHINGHAADMTIEESAFLEKIGVKSIFISPIFSRGEFWGAVALQNKSGNDFFNDDSVELEILELSARILAKTILREEAEQEAANLSEFQHIAFGASPLGFIVFNDNCKYVNCNETLLNLFSVTKEEFLENPDLISPEYQPNGNKSRDKMNDYMKRVLSGQAIKTDWMYCSYSGEQIPCEITLTRIKQGDKYTGIGFIYDLRSIKNMEKEIKLLKTEAEKIYYDALTGIYNRRYLDENLSRLLKTLSRANNMLSIMMIDIDRFKQYNDTYGHDKGDTCLKIIAETLSRSITRETDFVARYGGEEFVIVLPNTDRNGACIIAEKLLENILRCRIIHEKSDVNEYVTVSIGVTTSKVDHLQNSSDYIKRSDEMLYMSKQSGRNRYTFAYL